MGVGVVLSIWIGDVVGFDIFEVMVVFLGVCCRGGVAGG